MTIPYIVSCVVVGVLLMLNASLIRTLKKSTEVLREQNERVAQLIQRNVHLEIQNALDRDFDMRQRP